MEHGPKAATLIMACFLIGGKWKLERSSSLATEAPSGICPWHKALSLRVIPVQVHLGSSRIRASFRRVAGATDAFLPRCLKAGQGVIGMICFCAPPGFRG